MDKIIDSSKIMGPQFASNADQPLGLSLEETAAIILSMDIEAVECPKCGFNQPKGPECIKCGLIFKKSKHQNRVRTFSAI